jgi:hypothetical protein
MYLKRMLFIPALASAAMLTALVSPRDARAQAQEPILAAAQHEKPTLL